MPHKTYHTGAIYRMAMVGLIISLGWMFIGAPSAHTQSSSILYVKPGATGNCSAWDNSCGFQEALTAAQSSDEIWVAAGTYKPTSTTDRAISFNMKNGVAIYGGFAGTETLRSQRDWLANPAILSGEIGGTTKNDNSNHVIYTTGLDQSAILDGFTISSGHAFDGSELGGGMYNNASSPSLRNLIITNNYAFDGGGMYNDASSPTLQNVSFIGNQAESGGAGMENVNGSAPLLVDCVFSNQTSSFVGAGMVNSSSNPILINVLFTQNGNGDTNGGGMANFSSSPLLVNVVFWNNTAAWGGAITNWLSNPTLVNVTISNNSAGTQGGGIYNYNNSAPLIRNSIIWGNSVTSPSGVGPQIYNNPGAPVIRSTTIQGGCPAGSNCDASVLNLDPLFVNPTTGDLHPQSTSGVINQGSNAYLPADTYDLDGDSDTTELIPYDLDQEARILNTTVDLGAFEVFINTPPVITEGESTPYADGLILHATDPENDPLSWSIATPPAFGSASVDPATGTVSYTPSPSCNRVASFEVQVSDGELTDSITILGSGSTACLWYVWASAAGNNDGSSWANAFTDLQTALGVSQAGDEIWVAAGTYKPTSGTDRAISFNMKNGVAIYGGFAGTETSRSERDWLANPTILSGDLAGNDYPGFVNINENSRRVIYNTGLNNTAILDGFTITAGHADFESNNDTGAGMYNDSSSPQLLHLVFTNNYAFYAGGGMYNVASSPFLQDVSFIHNSADYKGGGMLNTNGSSPTLINVNFAGNGILQTSGGGMFNTGSNPTLVNVVFWNNSGGQGAGIYNDLSNPTLINVTISNNNANTQGGGIYNANNSAPLIRNSIIWGNTTSGVGPEIYNNPGAPIIRSSIIKGGCPAGSDCDASVLFVDPNFVNLPAGNVRPQLASPAHDAGSESYLPADTYDLDGDGDTAELIPYDMDHLNRILNSAVDAGAYETLANFSPVISEGDNIPYTDGLVLHATDPENDSLSWSIATPPAFGSASVDPVSGAVSYTPSPHCGRVAPFVVQVTDGTSVDSINILDGSGIVCPWFVQTSAAGANNGTSWPDAFTSLQSALIAAQPGDEIWVAAGTYKPTSGTDRTISFSMKNSVAIYGGFAGTETLRSQRDWLNNPTILSGDLAGNDTTNFGNRTDNSFHVILNNALDNTALLDGFTIQGGWAWDEVSGTDWKGGGIYNNNSNPRLNNLIFIQNEAVQGAAMFNASSSPLTTNLLFHQNKAGLDGGAIANWLSNPVLINVTIANNSAGTQGGGIYNTNNSAPLIRNSIIWGNSVTSPTGVGPQIYNNPGAPVIRSTTIQGGCPAGSNCDASVLNVDPLFVNLSTGDLHPQPWSGTLNQGSNTYLPADAYDLDGDSDTTELLPYDLDQEPRILNATVDLGAFETFFNMPPVITEGESIPYTDGLVLHATDPENDPLSWSIATPPAFGSASVDPASGAVSYTPLPHCGRVAPFVVQVTDGTSVDFINILDSSGAACLWYVRASAAGANNGTSWPDAFTDLQSALSAAQSGDEIWVAAGTYKPTSGTDRTISFSMKNGVAIYGGFAGTETLRSQRDWLTSPTILSGDLAGNDTTGNGLPNTDEIAENSYHIFYNTGLDNTAILDGFTIRGGNANGSSLASAGGGVFNSQSSPVFTNLVFAGSYAVNGGGMNNNTSSHSFLSNIWFLNNTSYSGGALYNTGASSPTLIRITISGNRAAMYGGGMQNNNGSNPLILNSTLFNNYAASRGGGISNGRGSSPHIINTLLYSNSSPTGGGVSNYDNCSPVMINVTVSKNTASTIGGAIYSYTTGKVTLQNSIVWGNSTEIAGPKTITNSIVKGVIGSDPLFVNTAVSDFHIQSGSPAIDTGDKTLLPADTYDLDGDGNTAEIIPIDLDSQPRVNNGMVDMGAYETTGMPFNLTEPFIEDIPVHYAALSVNNGSWENSPTSYTYQWQRAPIVEGPYSDIPEAVNPSYTTTRYDLGFFLRVLVTACNAYGCTPAFSPSVLLPNSAPVIISPPGIVTIPEDAIYTVTLTASDDDEEDELIWLISSPPAHGTVSITKAGRLRYIPNLNWHGSDSLTLIVSDGRASASTVVTLNITPLNDPPVNTLPPSITPLTPSHTSTLTAAPGEWNDAADGSVLDAPVFQWQKADLAEGPFANIVSATAANYTLARYDFGRYLRARVTVCDQGDPGNRCTIAYGQALLINNSPPVIVEDQADGLLNGDNSLTVSLTVSDAENDPLYWRIDQQPASGSATINFSTGLMHYYPNDGFSGSDTFTISASDGGASDQVIIRVSIGSPGTNERPQNSTLPVITPADPTHLALISTDEGIWTGSGTIIYAYQWQRSSEETGPYLNLVGHTNAQYQLTRFDHGLWFRAQVNACNLAGCTSVFSLPVHVTNQAPSITNAPSSIQLSEDGYYALQMTATDDDGDLLTWFLTGSPEHGTASISLDGMLYYRPQGNWNGSDQFSIAVSDGGSSNTATLSTTVAAVNDPPVNTTPPVITPSSPNHRQILQATSGIWNDDADGATMSAPTYHWQKSRTLEGPYLNITDADANQYTLTRFENGQYVRVRVMVCDNGNPGTRCTLAYSQPVWVANTAPVITQGEMISVSMNANGSFPVTTLSATDLENDQITWFISDAPDHGSLTIGYFNSRLSYRPLPSYSGSDTFSIIAWDGGAADQIIVQVNNIAANALVEPEPLITLHYPGQSYRPGDPLLLEIQIHNASQDMPAQLSVTLPPGAIFEPGESLTNYTQSGQSLVYTLGTGQSNADLTISIPILLDPTLQDIQPLNFEVSLGSQVVSFGIFPYLKDEPKRLFLPIIFP